MSKKTNPEAQPGDGLRSLKTSNVFRIVNFELYTRPNIVIMGLGLLCMTGCAAYIAYMRTKYDNLGFYSAIKEDGTEQFMKRKSKWD